MSSIFGDLDVDQIPDDPNFIASGIYHSQVAKAEVVTKRDGLRAFKITFVIEEPNDEEKSKYHGRYPNKWYNLFDKRDTAAEPLSPEEEQENSRLKQALKTLGITIEQMKVTSSEGMTDLVKGNYCMVNINNWPDKNDPEVKRSGVYDIRPVQD